MSVKKVFIILITIVACVIIGAFILNVLMPNVVTQTVNAVESAVYSATGLTMDFNGDGSTTSTIKNNDFGAAAQTDTTTSTGAGVAGFQ